MASQSTSITFTMEKILVKRLRLIVVDQISIQLVSQFLCKKSPNTTIIISAFFTLPLKKLQIPYPFKYQIINQMGDKVKQDTLLEANAIQRRIEKDYWGRMWFKAQGLKEPEKKHKNKKQHKKERKKPHIEKIPQFNFKPRILPNPPSF